MGKMSVSIYMKGYYEDFHALDRRKNKANSKPNKANMPVFGWKSEVRNPKPDNSCCVAGCLLPRVGRETR